MDAVADDCLRGNGVVERLRGDEQSQAEEGLNKSDSLTVAASMRRPVVSSAGVTADQREAPQALPGFSDSRHAPLPFALFVEPVAPVPVGVLISNVGRRHPGIELTHYPKLGWSSSCGFPQAGFCRGVAQRLIDLARDPQVMQEHSRFRATGSFPRSIPRFRSVA